MKTKKRPVVEFQEEGHLYTVDGKPSVSVSELTQHLENPTGRVPAGILARAADIGRKVHAAIASYTRGKTMPLSGQEETAAFEAFLCWVKEHPAAPFAVEMVVHNSVLHYCGTLDRIDKEGKALIIRDWKTGLVSYTAFLQLALYALAYEDQEGKAIHRGEIIHLDKRTGIFTVHPQDEYDMIRAKMAAKALCTLSAWKSEIKINGGNSDDGN